jgi:hypothetical protein
VGLERSWRCRFECGDSSEGKATVFAEQRRQSLKEHINDTFAATKRRN